jgi:hypothetical protein
MAFRVVFYFSQMPGCLLDGMATGAVVSLASLIVEPA